MSRLQFQRKSFGGFAYARVTISVTIEVGKSEIRRRQSESSVPSCFQSIRLNGHLFTKFIPLPEGNRFEQMLKLFLQLLSYTNGDISEVLQWMNQLDAEYRFTDKQYGMGNFINDLKEKGYIKENPEDGSFEVTSKSTQSIRKRSLEEIFGKLRKGKGGSHRTVHTGHGDETGSDRKKFSFGDSIDQVDLTSSLHNAQVNHGIEQFTLTEDDLELYEKEHKSQTATVLMIDISRSS